MKSLHVLAPIPSRYDFWTVSTLYTQYSTFPCWNQQLQIQFLITFNPHLHQSLLTMNQNSKFLKYLIPRLTTTVIPASYCILSIGQGMRVPMKKPPGYSLQNLDMLLNSSQTSTLHTQTSPVLCQVFPDSDFATFWFSPFLRITLVIMSKSF